jgi:hypothetical protein
MLGMPILRLSDELGNTYQGSGGGGGTGPNIGQVAFVTPPSRRGTVFFVDYGDQRVTIGDSDGYPASQ